MNPSKINGFSIGDHVVINPESEHDFRRGKGVIEDLGFHEHVPFAKVKLSSCLSVVILLKDLVKGE